VVAALDVGETAEGLLYMVMELAEGPTLAEVLEAGPIEPERAMAIVAQIARGLAHAHQRGLVHRDLKPGNVILEAGDRARIVDFGIALVIADGSTRLTAHGLVVGTPRYMAPEQALGEEVDARTDTFALGLIAYELIAGVLPHDGDGIEVALRYLTDPLPPVRARAPRAAVSPLVDALLARMLDKDPAARPADGAIAGELARLTTRRMPKLCGAMSALRR
jgi:serine/threonine protein kinase